MEVAAQDPRSTASGGGEQRQLDRLNAFSDGVFAIAITLLVLSVEVPDVRGDDLGSALRDLGPDVTAYFIGFAVIGLFWFGHHVAFSTLTRSSPRLVAVNLVLLSLIALMPFTTSLMGGYEGEPIAIAVYAFNVGLAALVNAMVDLVAARDGLRPGRREESRDVLIAGVLRPAVFFASIPVAFLSVTVAQLTWLTLFGVPAASLWLSRR